MIIVVNDDETLLVCLHSLMICSIIHSGVTNDREEVLRILIYSTDSHNIPIISDFRFSIRCTHLSLTDNYLVLIPSSKEANKQTSSLFFVIEMIETKKKDPGFFSLLFFSPC